MSCFVLFILFYFVYFINVSFSGKNLTPRLRKGES